MQFTTVVVAALASLASAQKVQVVTVSTSNNSLVYTPSNIKAAVGDKVQFQFVAGNHTVTQSTFDQPCHPINSVMSNVTGFHSGYMPAAAGAASGTIPTYTVQINNTTPVWVYCAQGKHCQAGMVMVINENTAANASRSLAAFKQLASAQTANVAPTTGTTGGSTTGTTSGSGSTTTGSTGGTTGTGTASGSTTGGTTGTGTTPTTAGSSMVKVGGSLGLAGLAAALMLL